jgi:SNF2-related domain
MPRKTAPKRKNWLAPLLEEESEASSVEEERIERSRRKKKKPRTVKTVSTAAVASEPYEPGAVLHAYKLVDAQAASIITGRRILWGADSSITLVTDRVSGTVIADDSDEESTAAAAAAASGSSSAAGSSKRAGVAVLAEGLPDRAAFIAPELWALILPLISDKLIALHQHSSADGSEAHLLLALRPAAFAAASATDRPPITKPRLRRLRELLYALHSEQLAPLCRPAEAKVPPVLPQELYSAVERGREGNAELQEQIRNGAQLPPLPALQPELRRYQQAAVAWMLKREAISAAGASPTAASSSGNSSSSSSGSSSSPRVSVIELTGWVQLPVAAQYDTSSSTTSANESQSRPEYVWYNVLNGCTTWQLPAELQRERHEPSGGILADEMGLGKTVETLALMLANPYTGSDPVALAVTVQRIAAAVDSNDDDAASDADAAGVSAEAAAAGSVESEQSPAAAAAAAAASDSDEAEFGDDTAPLPIAATAAASVAATSAAAAAGSSSRRRSSGTGTTSGSSSADRRLYWVPSTKEVRAALCLCGRSAAEQCAPGERNWTEPVVCCKCSWQLHRRCAGVSPAVTAALAAATATATSSVNSDSAAAAATATAGVDDDSDYEEDVMEIDHSDNDIRGSVSADDVEVVDYTCVACDTLARNAEPSACKSTLMVCPPAILQQWERELSVHSKPGTLKVSVSHVCSCVQ